MKREGVGIEMNCKHDEGLDIALGYEKTNSLFFMFLTGVSLAVLICGMEIFYKFSRSSRNNNLSVIDLNPDEKMELKLIHYEELYRDVVNYKNDPLLHNNQILNDVIKLESLLEDVLFESKREENL